MRRSLCVLVLMCLVGLWPLPVRAAEIPRGIFAMVGSVQLRAGDAVLANPDVAGILLTRSWKDIEAIEGVYNWGDMESRIAVAAAAGKQVRLGIPAGGQHTPAWVFQLASVQVFSWTGDNPYEPTYGKIVTIPVFWDPVFLGKKMAFLTALAAKFAANPGVSIVGSACINPTTDDWAWPNISDVDAGAWQALGYTTDALVAACTDTLDTMMRLFPGKTVFVPIGSMPRALEADPDAVQRRMITHAKTYDPGRYGFGNGALNTGTPVPSATMPTGRWKALYEQRPAVMLQMLWSATDVSNCRLNGKKKPCDPATTLAAAGARGVQYQAQWLEVYYPDVVSPSLAGTIRALAQALRLVPKVTP